MYEVAPVAGNKIEAACALKRLQLIMGQISSNTATANNNSTVNRNHSTRFSKTHYHNRHSAVQPLRKDEIALLRDPQKGKEHQSNAFSSIRQSMHIKKTTKDSSSGATTAPTAMAPNSNPRPVTISEMNAYNIEKNEAAASSKTTTTTADQNTTTPTTNETETKEQHTLPTATVVDGNCSSSSNNNSCNVVNNNHKKTANEFYTVGDGYHKTDTCYFRSPDGNFHKFPSDSYHKMSEKCYFKSADGSFRRIESTVINGDIKSNGSGSGAAATNSSQMTVKNQMMRFLKRSKSHTPATMKEMQKEREQRQRDRDRERNKRASTATSTTTTSHHNSNHHENSSHHHHHTNSTSGNKNNKVVVTMMENGGLPIVATSKASKHHSRDKVESSSDKSRSKTRVGILFLSGMMQFFLNCGY